jgi:hypothetical protein
MAAVQTSTLMGERSGDFRCGRSPKHPLGQVDSNEDCSENFRNYSRLAEDSQGRAARTFD